MITLNDVSVKLRKYETFNTVPDSKKFPHYNPNHVFDIEQSVKWNREQVDIANKARAEESIRLKNERNALYSMLIDTVEQYIIQETNCNKIQSNLIYTFACDHNYDDFIEILDEVIEFYKDLKKAAE